MVTKLREMLSHAPRPWSASPSRKSLCSASDQGQFFLESALLESALLESALLRPLGAGAGCMASAGTVSVTGMLQLCWRPDHGLGSGHLVVVVVGCEGRALLRSYLEQLARRHAWKYLHPAASFSVCDGVWSGRPW